VTAAPADTAIIPATKVAAIVGSRNAALATVTRGAALIAEGHRLVAEAEGLSRLAYGDAHFHDVDHAAQEAFKHLFARFDADASVAAFRRNMDARTWVRLVDLAGIQTLMDRTAKDQFLRELAGAVPEVTEDAILSVLEGLAGDAQLIFQRGLARAFSDLDRRFKSHDAFKIGSRMILTRIFDDSGYWNYHNRARETIADVERVFAILDGKAPDPGALTRVIDGSRKGYGARQGMCASPYFRIRTFMNGNAHLWFTRDDLVDRANLLLGEYYGAVLPDGVPAGGPEADLRSSSRELSKDLAFYPTPEGVARLAVKRLHLDADSRVLEPSAGEGGLAAVLLATGASVTAVEVDPGRYAALERLGWTHRRLSPVRANFLRMTPTPYFTHVAMNPPFYGTHWIDHVVHAYEFLAPGGELVAILPVTAELGESKRHVEFREWAAKRAQDGAWRMFQDLPPESFAPSGTRVQTVTLCLRRPR
jgi:hypothetical protein